MRASRAAAFAALAAASAVSAAPSIPGGTDYELPSPGITVPGGGQYYWDPSRGGFFDGSGVGYDPGADDLARMALDAAAVAAQALCEAAANTQEILDLGDAVKTLNERMNALDLSKYQTVAKHDADIAQLADGGDVTVSQCGGCKFVFNANTGEYEPDPASVTLVQYDTYDGTDYAPGEWYPAHGPGYATGYSDCGEAFKGVDGQVAGLVAMDNELIRWIDKHGREIYTPETGLRPQVDYLMENLKGAATGQVDQVSIDVNEDSKKFQLRHWDSPTSDGTTIASYLGGESDPGSLNVLCRSDDGTLEYHQVGQIDFPTNVALERVEGEGDDPPTYNIVVKKFYGGGGSGERTGTLAAVAATGDYGDLVNAPPSNRVDYVVTDVEARDGGYSFVRKHIVWDGAGGLRFDDEEAEPVEADWPTNVAFVADVDGEGKTVGYTGHLTAGSATRVSKLALTGQWHDIANVPSNSTDWVVTGGSFDESSRTLTLAQHKILFHAGGVRFVPDAEKQVEISIPTCAGDCGGGGGGGGDGGGGDGDDLSEAIDELRERLDELSSEVALCDCCGRLGRATISPPPPPSPPTTPGQAIASVPNSF